ncbi:MAG TPA: DUF5658 family protein [Vicinamibacterales bacterium]|nr:DUF5658 family protein [Vicinamibacterales bacterium]
MDRFARRIAAALALVCATLAASPAAAQELQSTSLREAAGQLAVPPDPQPPLQLPGATGIPQPRRPSSLVPLYVSFAALQALDVHSTRRAIERGGVEANPVMKGLAGNSAGLLAVKAAGTAGVIYVSEKMWKKNRTAAVIFMVAANSAMTWVVQHNYRAGG